MAINTIVIASNNFGFGPISTAYSIAESLLEHHVNLKIVLLTDGSSDYLFNHRKNIDFINIKSLRDEQLITKVLLNFSPKNTIIFSSMNRFAILASKKIGMKSVLIDGLYWFWPSRPKEYDLADYQLRIILPWQKETVGTVKVKFFAEPINIKTISKNKNLQNTILLAINGYITPFHTERNNIYLRLISKLMNNFKFDGKLLAVGNKSIEANLSLNNKTAYFEALNKNNYLKKVRDSKYLLLSGGSNSFCEALVMKKYFLFSFPSNQSQYALINEVARFTNKPIRFWCPLLSLANNHQLVLEYKNEKDAIEYLILITEELLSKKDIDTTLQKISDEIINNIDLAEKEGIYNKLSQFAPRLISANGKVADYLLEILNEN